MKFLDSNPESIQGTLNGTGSQEVSGALGRWPFVRQLVTNRRPHVMLPLGRL